jgi:hypothetical protein
LIIDAINRGKFVHSNREQECPLDYALFFITNSQRIYPRHERRRYTLTEVIKMGKVMEDQSPFGKKIWNYAARTNYMPSRPIEGLRSTFKKYTQLMFKHHGWYETMDKKTRLKSYHYMDWIEYSIIDFQRLNARYTEFYQDVIRPFDENCPFTNIDMLINEDDKRDRHNLGSSICPITVPEYPKKYNISNKKQKEWKTIVAEANKVIDSQKPTKDPYEDPLFKKDRKNEAELDIKQEVQETIPSEAVNSKECGPIFDQIRKELNYLAVRQYKKFLNTSKHPSITPWNTLPRAVEIVVSDIKTDFDLMSCEPYSSVQPLSRVASPPVELEDSDGDGAVKVELMVCSDRGSEGMKKEKLGDERLSEGSWREIWWSEGAESSGGSEELKILGCRKRYKKMIDKLIEGEEWDLMKESNNLI